MVTVNHTVPEPPTNAPYLPSVIEAKHYLYGFPSKPRLVARSNPDIWERPTGPEAYLKPKELIILGAHPLSVVWEDTIGPALDAYLLGQQVKVSVLNCFRIALAGEASLPPPPFVFVGVIRDSLLGQAGLDAALGCRSILVENGLDDVHVIIYESAFTRFKALYKPDLDGTNDPAAAMLQRFKFSTSLGLSISPAESPNVEGTGSFFFLDKAKPGVLFLLTARHVLFNPLKEENEDYFFHAGSNQAAGKVMFMGKAAFDSCCQNIEVMIDALMDDVNDFRSGLERVNVLEDRERAEREKTVLERKLAATTASIESYQNLLDDIRNWGDEGNRVIGHVTLSPRISVNYGDDGYTDDWAVIEIYPSMIGKLNFVGNIMDLSSLPRHKLKMSIKPHQSPPGNLPSFKYPLLRFSGTISDEEMFSPNTKFKHQDNDPVIMVIKNGGMSNLTVGRLNNIRAFVREYVNDQPGEMSKELCVLPRDHKSGPFSARGDSGSAVIDGIGRVCGIITGGDGSTDNNDCTFVTSINFLLKRLQSFGIDANIYPHPADL
ncbi:hypothetical protein GALMADRAFT_155693 [Galerina marginata CBS 339.88]|uniref:Peptidase S1 domain-containing protein n=1 Tax=Galerina marginata (strain CBS 339.88) TaxID=685588 RepID=A0A067TAV5_GALM3|nr:hypothetical protein GALMADRAFT_155693 [Galerina marginata CBS 339.88]